MAGEIDFTISGTAIPLDEISSFDFNIFRYTEAGAAASCSLSLSLSTAPPLSLSVCVCVLLGVCMCVRVFRPLIR